MKWTIRDKSTFKYIPKYGDLKVKKHFCFLPKSNYDAKAGITTYYWLETVYIAYEWTEGVEWDCTTGLELYYSDFWQKVGIATSYNNAVKRIWR